MAVTTDMGFKKPEGADTFYAFIENVCDNIDTLEECLDGKSANTHNHNTAYNTKAEISALLEGKAAASHTHDDRYYTETEVTALLASKAAASHTHDSRYYTETEVDRKFSDLITTGTWNPRISGGTVWGSPTYTASGSYFKIGKLVYINGYMNITNKGTMAGALSIDRLPFAAAEFSGDAQRYLITTRAGYGSLANGYVIAPASIAGGEEKMSLCVKSTTNTAYDMTDTMLNNGAYIWVSGFYIAE